MEILVPVLLAAAVFTAAMGSSSVGWASQAGGTLRWAALALVALAALPWGVPYLSRVPRPFAVAVAALAGVAVLSTAWSVRPRSTFERGGTFVVLSVSVILISAGATSSRRRLERVGAGLLAAAVLVAVAGVVVYLVDHHLAVQAAAPGMPARLRGFGQDPDTAALLFSVILPLPVAVLLGPVSRGRRMIALAIVVLLYGSILASGSRGAIIGGVGGVAVYLALKVRPLRALLGAEVLLGVVAVLSILIAGARPAAPTIPLVAPGQRATIDSPRLGAAAPATAALPGRPVRPAPSGSSARVAWWQVGLEPTFPRWAVPTPFVSPLAEIGAPGLYAYKRLLSYGSGRVFAWIFAIRQGLHRPFLGYGFGTESVVFRTVFYYYQSSFTENSYVGIFLELGLAGLGLLVLPFALCGVLGARAIRRRLDFDRQAAAVGFAISAAALLAGVFQSYLYSVGNLATLTAWTCVALTAAIVSTGLRGPVPA